MQPQQAVQVKVDGQLVAVAPGATILEACDAAGRYIPRLCYYPGLGCAAEAGDCSSCGVCAVRLGDAIVLACATPVFTGMNVVTDGEELRAVRQDRLSSILARHPHVCLTCPDRDGCTRDECTYGSPANARCCSEAGGCELGRLVHFVIGSESHRAGGAPAAPRAATVEGRIRREPGLCIGCGRCVRICATRAEAGAALQMIRLDDAMTETAADVPATVAAPGAPPAPSPPAGPAVVAAPRQGTLRVSGCTFCGLCVLVCPAGALTAPGEAGRRWLAGRRERAGLQLPAMPPEPMHRFGRDEIDKVASVPGVIRFLDASGQILHITGVADLHGGLERALVAAGSQQTAFFQFEPEPLYTQRESELLATYVQNHGHLPPGNDLEDDLFADEDL